MQEKAPELPEVDAAAMASLQTLGQIADYMAAQLGTSAAPAPARAAAPAAPSIDLQALLRDVVAEMRQVIDAFDDVQRAQQDRDRQRNEADSYRNDILPRARGVVDVEDREVDWHKAYSNNKGSGVRAREAD